MGEVRQVTLDDREALFAFFDRAYAERSWFKHPHRWQWLYIDNPAIPNDYGIPAWIAIRDGRIVGHTGAMLCRARIGTQTRLVAWSIDTIVLPEARGTGIGKRLQAANQAANQFFMSLSMSPANRAIKRKLGQVEGPTLTVSYRVCALLPEPLLAGPALRFGRFGRAGLRIALVTGVPAALCCLYSCRLRYRQGPLPLADSDVDLELLDGNLGDEWNERLESWTRDRDFYVLRDADYLNWKYRRQPHADYQIYKLLRAGDVIGLAVTRVCNPPEQRLGVIAELLVVDPTEQEAALVAVSRELEKQSVAGIYFAAPSVSKPAGYMNLSNETIMFRDDYQLAPHSYEAPLLTFGDHDIDQVPNVRQPSLPEFTTRL